MTPLTELERNAVGGQSTPPMGAQTGLPTNFNPTLSMGNVALDWGGGASSTPVASPIQEPTIGDQLSGIKSEALRIQDILNQRQAEESAFLMQTVSDDPDFIDTDVDEDAINRATLKMFQDQIDATNQVYDQLLGEARLEGEGRIGSQRAIAARGGLLGSDFAGSQKARVQDFNTDQQRSIQAERTAAIGAILGTARQTAQEEIANRRAARQQGAENWLDYIANSQQNRLNNINSVAQAFLAQGINPTEMDETEIAAIASEIGAQPADIITAYQANQAEGGADGDFGFMSTSGGIFRTDPATGEAVFIPSGGGGTTGAGGTITETGTEISPFDAARTIISENPQLTDDQIKAALLEQTGLNVTEINSLIDTRENRQLPTFDDNVTSQIVNKLRDTFDYNAAVAYIEAGQITSGGKKYTLTDEQKQQLKAALDDERGFFERLIPGGN